MVRPGDDERRLSRGDAEVRAVRARARVADNPAHHVERAPHVRGGFRVSGRTSAARLREHLEPARLHLRGGAHGRRARPVRERPRKQVVNDVRLDIPQALEVQLGGFLAHHLDRGQRGGQVAVEQVVAGGVLHDALEHVREVILRGPPRGGELRERSRGVLRLRRCALHAQHLEALARLGFVRARSVQARRRRRGDAARRGDHRGVAVRDEHREFLRGAYERLRRAVRQLNEVLERRRERADALLL